MIIKHFEKYYKNYLLILFVIGSYILNTIYRKRGLDVYYIIALIIIILGFTKFTLIKDLGLSFAIFKNKKLYIFLIPTIILSNILLFLIKKYFIGGEIQLETNESILKLILVFLFLNSIRIFGEELIFRGFLLVKDFKTDYFLFWKLNIGQALFFSLIHSLFVDDLTSKFVLGSFTFISSIYFGWLNRKFDSLLPSWIIHWMNGIQVLIIAYFNVYLF